MGENFFVNFALNKRGISASLQFCWALNTCWGDSLFIEECSTVKIFNMQEREVTAQLLSNQVGSTCLITTACYYREIHDNMFVTMKDFYKPVM